MHLSIRITTQGNVKDADADHIKATVEALTAACADAGLPVRADFSATNPDGPVAAAKPAAPAPAQTWPPYKAPESA